MIPKVRIVSELRRVAPQSTGEGKPRRVHIGFPLSVSPLTGVGALEKGNRVLLSPATTPFHRASASGNGAVFSSVAFCFLLLDLKVKPFARRERHTGARGSSP